MGSDEFADGMMEKNRSGELRSPVSQHHEVRDVLRPVAVYAGFPPAWNAIATANAALADWEESQ